MRFSAYVLAAAAIVLSGPAAAQTWTEYLNLDLRFAIDFAGPPSTEDITYTTERGALVSAHRYAASRDTGQYIVTVVHYSTVEEDVNAAIQHGADLYRAKGEVFYDDVTQLDGIPGQQLSVVDTEGRRYQVIVYFFEDRLYIVDGNVGPGAPPPSQFQQSFAIVDALGEHVVLDGDEGAPAP